MSRRVMWGGKRERHDDDALLGFSLHAKGRPQAQFDGLMQGRGRPRCAPAKSVVCVCVVKRRVHGPCVMLCDDGVADSIGIQNFGGRAGPLKKKGGLTGKVHKNKGNETELAHVNMSNTLLSLWFVHLFLFPSWPLRPPLLYTFSFD